jgi:ELWxxDGT repeat protein
MARSRYVGASVVLRAEPLEDRLLPSLTPTMLFDINAGSGSSGPREFTQVNNLVFFTATNEYGNQLWASDGTAAGTYLVKDVSPGKGAYPFPLTNVNGTLFFGANFGQGLWVSNGTNTGTSQISPVLVSGYPTNVNGTLFFQGYDAMNGSELWESNGSGAGTFIVRDINPGSAGSYPVYLTNVNGTLFFSAKDSSDGYQLWESTGAGATNMVTNINPGGSPGGFGFNPRYLTNVNGTLFFSAVDGTNGRELWESNGTTAGTVMVKDINLTAYSGGTKGSYPVDLTSIDGILVFDANDGIHGNELWESNGSPTGTFIVADVNPGVSGSSPGGLTNVNGTLFFSANDGIHGYELWRSTGVGATNMVADINPNDTNVYAGSYPRYLTNVSGTLFFSASDGANRELWESNGTAAGTSMVQDLNPGNPYDLTNVSGDLFFSVNDGTHGAEPWILPVSTASTTTIASSLSSPVVSQPVSFTATVNVTPGAGSPTGTVDFTVDGFDLTPGGVTLTGDQAIFTAGLSAGSHTIMAVYSGDGTFPSSNGSITESVTQAATSTALTASSNPSAFGQEVVFTATVLPVAPSIGLPKGTVDFQEGGTDLTPGGILLMGNQATFSTSALAVGTHTITAKYSGDNNFVGSQGDDSANPLIVGQGESSTFIAATPNSSVFGQPVTLIAFVSALSPAAGFPSGTVNFFADHTILASDVSLSNGYATFTTSALAVGSHRIGAQYNGDSNFQVSITAIPGDTVSKDGTTTILSASGNPSVFGQPVIFTATVNPLAPGGGTPIGTVDFEDGSTDLTPGGVSLSGNQATFSTSALAVGSHTITALYSGDGNFIGSPGDDSASPQVVENASSATSLVSVSGASVFGEPAAFVAVVTPVAPATGTPTGTVTFMDGSTTLAANVSLSGGHAGFRTTSLAVGTHTITAIYSGSASLMGSKDSATQVVSKAATSTGLTSSQNPSVFGQAVVFTATVLASAPGSGTPTGTMDFKEGTTDLTPGGVNLTAGRATFSTSSLSIGQHTLTASYGGDANFTASQRAAPQTVNKASTRMPGLAAFPNPAVFGQVISFTASVLALFPGKGTPTGMVTFLDGSTTLGSLSLTGGRATFTTASLTRGNHAISATYSGDSSFLPSATTGAFGEPVQKDATTAAVTSSANPAVVGNVVTFMAVVQASAPGSGKPTGTVTFTDITTVLGTGTLNGAGQATFSTSALIVGTHAITATYAGDNNFTSSFSPVLAETVKTMALKSPLIADQLAVPFPAAEAPSMPPGSSSMATTGTSTVSAPGSLPASAHATAEADRVDRYFVAITRSDRSSKPSGATLPKRRNASGWLDDVFPLTG